MNTQNKIEKYGKKRIMKLRRIRRDGIKMYNETIQEIKSRGYGFYITGRMAYLYIALDYVRSEFETTKDFVDHLEAELNTVVWGEHPVVH